MNGEINVFQPEQGNKFYMCTVVVETETDTGKIKKVKEVHLVESCTPKGVEEKISKQMEGTIFSWRITNIAESKIQFVY